MVLVSTYHTISTGLVLIQNIVVTGSSIVGYYKANTTKS